MTYSRYHILCIEAINDRQCVVQCHASWCLTGRLCEVTCIMYRGCMCGAFIASRFGKVRVLFMNRGYIGDMCRCNGQSHHEWIC